MAFDEKIKENVALLQSAQANQYSLDKNDYFYGGDVTKWIKFGNTLRIKMAQRLEKADKPFYTSVLNDVLSNQVGITLFLYFFTTLLLPGFQAKLNRS